MPKHDWQKQFYESKAWRYMRAFVVARDNGICQKCFNHIFQAPVVHHKEELTEANYHDHSISLNPELLITVCAACHNDIHERLKQGAKEVIVNDDLSIDYSKR